MRDDRHVFDQEPGDGVDEFLQDREALRTWCQDVAYMTGEDVVDVELLAPLILTDLQDAGCKITLRVPPLPDGAIGAMVAPRIHIQSSGLTQEHVALTVGVLVGSGVVLQAELGRSLAAASAAAVLSRVRLLSRDEAKVARAVMRASKKLTSPSAEEQVKWIKSHSPQKVDFDAVLETLQDKQIIDRRGPGGTYRIT